MHMNDKPPIDETNQDNKKNPRSITLVWNVPTDVIREWTALPQEELQSFSLIMDALLDDIDDTLAVTAMNSTLFPVAANELRKRLKDFRLSLENMPLPTEAQTKKLH